MNKGVFACLEDGNIAKVRVGGIKRQVTKDRLLFPQLSAPLCHLVSRNHEMYSDPCPVKCFMFNEL